MELLFFSIPVPERPLTSPICTKCHPGTQGKTVSAQKNLQPKQAKSKRHKAVEKPSEGPM